MLLIGLILVIAALVTIGYLWFGTAGLDPVEVDLGIFTTTLSPLWIFLLGAASVLVLAIGTALLIAGLRRRQRQRRELKELRRKADALERDRGPVDRPAADRPVERTPRTDDRTGDGRRPADAASDNRVIRDDPERGENRGRASARDDTVHLPGDRRRPTEDG